jgi:hypothetical protein
VVVNCCHVPPTKWPRDRTGPADPSRTEWWTHVGPHPATRPDVMVANVLLLAAFCAQWGGSSSAGANDPAVDPDGNVLPQAPESPHKEAPGRYCTSRWATYQTKQPNFASVNADNQQKRKMRMENTAAEPLDFFWVDPDGSEVAMTKLAAGRKFTMMTASGHAFRAYFIRPDGTLKVRARQRSGQWNVAL